MFRTYWKNYLSDKIWGPIEVETNDVLFFPGWLTHKTEKVLLTILGMYFQLIIKFD